MNHMNINGANMPNGIGGMAGMQAGANGAAAINRTPEELDFKTRLNTYIYDYLLKNEQYDVARAFCNSSLTCHIKNNAKKRPNGMGGDSMDTDSKDNIDLKKPDDLPDPDKITDGCFENSFLLDWFTLFWEVFLAPRQARNPKMNPTAVAYMNNAREQSRMSNEQRNNMLRQPSMVPNNMGPAQYRSMMQMGAMQRNRMNPGMQNLTPQQQHQVMQRQQLMQHQQNMERGGSDVDMNGGQRPRSPNGENAPSPSKKPRLEPPQFEGNVPMMPNGRMPQMMHGQQVIDPGISEQQFLMHHVTDPSFAGNSQESLPDQNPRAQRRKSLDSYSQALAQQQRANMPMPMIANQGTAMMQTGMDMTNPDFYANGQMRPGMPQPVNGQGGNHALQDYQMQLMLLEQQNKKRLLMARQEQDNLRPDQQGNMGGQQAFAPGMSPQGSRSGPSPNPSDQMKRGTPKLNQPGLPGSPMPDANMAGRGSPGAMNFSNGTMPVEMIKAMNNMGGDGGMQMGPNGANMRPPSSHPFNPQQMSQQQQLEMMRAQQNGRMPNANGANWPQGPQGQAQMGPQAGQAPVGTPQSRNAAMPPPQNVPAAGNNQNQSNPNNPNVNAGNANNNNNNNSNGGNSNANNNSNAANGRAASPAPSATATTPQTTNKANPKKPKADKERKRPNKKNTATAATPSAEGDNPPPTPQPQTPATPMHNQKSFNDNKGGQQNASNAQSVAPAPAPVPPVAPPPADTMMNHFPDMEGAIEGNGDLNMDFGGLEGEDVLNQFDFDQFISNDATQEFDLSAFGSYEGLEASNDV